MSVPTLTASGTMIYERARPKFEPNTPIAVARPRCSCGNQIRDKSAGVDRNSVVDAATIVWPVNCQPKPRGLPSKLMPPTTRTHVPMHCKVAPVTRPARRPNRSKICRGVGVKRKEEKTKQYYIGIPRARHWQTTPRCSMVGDAGFAGNHHYAPKQLAKRKGHRLKHRMRPKNPASRAIQLNQTKEFDDYSK